jgi:hypothetical protein
MAANFDSADILRTWQIFRQPGEVTEVRILNAGGFLHTVSGYFDNIEDFTKTVSDMAADTNHPVPAIYFMPNPVSKALLARAANKVKPRAKNTTSDADIAALHWLLIDVDAERPAGISSTDEEHDAAISKATEIREFLIDERGWPAGAFVLADSGNGGHLNIKIDLLNLPENVALIRGCLKALDFLFSDERIHVDVTSQNPARIWKLYGTMARKGDSTTDRPHRLSRLLEVPAALETVTKEQLEALAAMRPRQEAAPKNQAGGKGFDPVQYCQTHNLPVHHTKPYAGGTLAVLEECVFDPSHKLSAFIGGWPNGSKAYGCHHNSCKDNRWQEAKAILEPNAAKGNETKDTTAEEISEDELNAYSLPEGPKFECNLPKNNFVSTFMEYGTDISDAYIEYWFAGGLFALAVVADKKIKMVMKQGPIYPNLYVSINGKSSLARKSTVVDKTETMLCETLPALLPSLVPTEFSPEAFTEHLSDNNHASWIRDEAAGVLSLMKKDYMRGFRTHSCSFTTAKPFTANCERVSEKTSRRNLG